MELCRNKMGRAHDKDARATEVFCSNRLATMVKKKKKGSPNMGHHIYRQKFEF